jgi:hypothetical protein
MVDGGASAAVGFVGRDREMAELIVGLDEAKAGRGGFFCWALIPGSGRAAWPTIPRRRLSCEGSAWAGDGAGRRVARPVFWPWVQSLRAFVRGVDPEALRSQLEISRLTLRKSCLRLLRFYPMLDLRRRCQQKTGGPGL